MRLRRCHGPVRRRPYHGCRPGLPGGTCLVRRRRVPGRAARRRQASLEVALAEAAETLAAAKGGALVLLAPDLSTQAQRAALAMADLLRATVDTATSGRRRPACSRRSGAAGPQPPWERCGTVRTCCSSGASIPPRYPRFLSRYALDPVGTHVPGGRAGRTVISVSVGRDRGPAGADLAGARAGQEIAALSVMRAVALGSARASCRPRSGPRRWPTGLCAAYAVLVHDAEPSGSPSATRTAPKDSSHWRRRSTDRRARPSAVVPVGIGRARKRCSRPRRDIRSRWTTPCGLPAVPT